jgi:hypothetical protein
MYVRKVNANGNILLVGSDFYLASPISMRLLESCRSPDGRPQSARRYAPQSDLLLRRQDRPGRAAVLPGIKADVEAFALESALAGKRTDTLLRYETTNERQLYRAIDQLERLQRGRAGDYVPPPVKLGLSTAAPEPRAAALALCGRLNPVENLPSRNCST